MVLRLVIWLGCFLGAQVFAGTLTAAVLDLPAKADELLSVSESHHIQYRLVLLNYEIEHQGGNFLNMTMEYELNPAASFPPSDEIRSYIDRFLQEYPNEDDFWEVVNRNLVLSLASTYPGLAAITFEMDVMPCEDFPHQRGSLVEYTPSGLREHWYFAMALDSDEAESSALATPDPTRLRIGYEYLPYSDVIDENYPDYNRVLERIEFDAAMDDGGEEGTAMQLVAEQIQQAFPMLRDVTLELR